MDIVSALAKISEITTSPNREIDPQELTEIVPKFFEKITEIKLRTCFNCGHHNISKLEKEEQRVYIFLVGDKHYLKDGCASRFRTAIVTTFKRSLCPKKRNRSG